jgi:MFS transporter, FHS family, glucose/mannose:H+ symporter
MLSHASAATCRPRIAQGKIAKMILQASRILSRTIIYLGFAATGVGMALPGSVLPTLLARWSLADSQAGLLFFLGWMSCSLGALFVRTSRSRSIAEGSIAIVVGSLGMAYGGKPWCFGFMAIFGLGLGLTMTSVSLLQAGRHPDRRGAELNRLNLVWAIGACLCPSLAAHSLQIASVRAIFLSLGIFFLLFCLWILVCERESNPVSSLKAQPSKSSWLDRFRLNNLALWPLAMIVAICLPTGIESSMGGWIAAYVQRTEHTVATTVTAGTCFWMGLLLSRTLSSFILSLRRFERAILRLSLVTVPLGALLLILTTSKLGILPGVFLVGFGLGPVYPLLLAIALEYSEKTTIFFIAGLGSAFLPWLTGIISSSTSSLRVGLLAPLAASILMLALGIHLTLSKNGRKPRLPVPDQPFQSQSL